MLNFQKKTEYWKFNPYASVQKWWALIATYTIHLISRFRCSKLVISIYQFGDEVSLIECSWWIENEGVCNSQKDIKQDNKQVWSEKRLPSHHLQFCPLSALFLARACFILLAEHISAFFFSSHCISTLEALIGERERDHCW